MNYEKKSSLEHQRRQKSSLHKYTWDQKTETKIFADIHRLSSGILSLDFQGGMEVIHKYMEHSKAQIIRNLKNFWTKSITSCIKCTVYG